MSDHSSLELAGTAVESRQDLGNQIIVVDIGNHPYAISVDDLVEVEHVPNVAPVPHTEYWIHGVVNLRGSILTLVDPARLLDVGSWSQTTQSRMLVVGRDDPVALAVDRLLGMRQLSEVVSPDVLDEMPGRVGDYIEAIYRDGDRFISVLDIRRILDEADRASHRSGESTPIVGGGSLGSEVSVMERGAS